MSEDWGELSPERIGRATASAIHKITATVRGGYATSRDRYRAQLIVERRTGMMVPSYENAAMKWGKETEPMARSAYNLAMGKTVEFAGFVIHPTIKMAGASPDGLVDADGLLEIKCPEMHTHYTNLITDTDKIDLAYRYQVQWQLACTGRKWCHWVSFDPRWPESDQLVIHRINRDNEVIVFLEREVTVFLKEVDKAIERLDERRAQAA